MKKYLAKFENEAAYDVFKASEDFVTPNVSWCVEENSVKWNPYAKPQHDYSQDYLTIVSTSDNNTIRWKANSILAPKTISVSTDDGSTWVDVASDASGVTLGTLNTGDKLLVKGNNTAYGTNSFYNYFTSSGQFNVEGNIMSLIYGDNFENQITLLETYTFNNLFYISNVVDAGNLVLPATTLVDYCYDFMFSFCASLTTAPELPATTLATGCYKNMFRGCSSLTAAPELPATTLAHECYENMLSGCTSLNYIKCLATNISFVQCLTGWVKGVAASGTFVKDSSMTGWATGDNGIPSDWTVEDAS